MRQIVCSECEQRHGGIPADDCAVVLLAPSLEIDMELELPAPEPSSPPALRLVTEEGRG